MRDCGQPARIASHSRRDQTRRLRQMKFSDIEPSPTKTIISHLWNDSTTTKLRFFSNVACKECYLRPRGLFVLKKTDGSVLCTSMAHICDGDSSRDQPSSPAPQSLPNIVPSMWACLECSYGILHLTMHITKPLFNRKIAHAVRHFRSRRNSSS